MSELWYVTVLYQTTRAGMGLRMGLRVALLFLVVVCGGGGHDGGVAAAAAAEEACADAPPAAHAKFTCMQYACLGLCEKKLAFLRTSCPATCGYCKYYLHRIISSSSHSYSSASVDPRRRWSACSERAGGHPPASACLVPSLPVGGGRERRGGRGSVQAKGSAPGLSSVIYIVIFCFYRVALPSGIRKKSRAPHAHAHSRDTSLQTVHYSTKYYV